MLSSAFRTRIYFYGTRFLIAVGLVFFVENPVLLREKPMIKVSKADAKRLKGTVETLASSSPARNFKNTRALNKAADFIADEFMKVGLQSRPQVFEVDGKLFRNLIVDLGPKSGDLVVIGAHYDVFDEQPGADDNASGVAGLIELARILAPLKDKLKRPIELVAYTLEEPPNFGDRTMGSFIHAAELKKVGVKLKLMISLEMIGYFSDLKWSQKYPTPFFYLLYPLTGDYISLIARPTEWSIMREAKAIFEGATSLAVKSANVPEFVPGVTYSDHYNYWDAGFPAMMITDTAFMRNQNYHQSGDTPEKLNYEKMAEVVNGVAAISVGL